MKFKLFILASLLIFSCNSSDNESISLYNLLPNESSVIININDLNNTKEILNKNKILPIVFSSTKEISTQLNLLSNKNSAKEGILSISNYGKDEVAFAYIRKSNSFDSIQKGDNLKNKYQNLLEEILQDVIMQNQTQNYELIMWLLIQSDLLSHLGFHK